MYYDIGERRDNCLTVASTRKREKILATFNEFRADTSPHAVFPLGGIGAGSVGLGADGRFQDWEIFNRPAKGSVNGFTHFAVRAEREGAVLDTRVLHGPFTGNRTGSHLARTFNAYGFGPRRQQMTGFPSFRSSVLTGPYPVADLSFEDPGFPGTVSLKALSPFIPLDDRSTSMPVAMFEVTFRNTSDSSIDYTLFGCIASDFVDIDATSDVTVAVNELATITCKTSHREDHLDHRQLCLATDHTDISYQHHLYRGNWFDTMEVYWKDITTPGRLKDRKYIKTKDLKAQNLADATEHSLLAQHMSVPAGESKTIRMAMSWYVPNMSKYWISDAQLCCQPAADTKMQWRNYYATQWGSATEVAADTLARWDDLKDRTCAFRDILADSTLPDPVMDAVSANLSIMKSPTVLRLEDGTFYGFEGCHGDSGCCEGSCTHVWNYQQALPFLFPALERSMRDADFFESQDPDTGGMAFRLSLPKGVGRFATRPCADGQFGNVMKAYRDFKLSGNEDWLRSIWPNIQAAIEYAWHHDNQDLWDPEQSGILGGRQHHTLDMELFGPNSWLAGFYLGALNAGSKIARIVGDEETSAHYQSLFMRGKKWVGENLFNGTWFYQKIDIKDKSTLQPYVTEKGQVAHVSGDIYSQYWTDEHEEIKYQIDKGCAIDQVLAEWHARLYGLDALYEPEQFASAVHAVYQHNFVERLGELANPCRVFGMEDECGTTICNWPEGVERPVIPLPYSQETMHGFEYAFGCQLMMIGEVEKGVRVFRAVRDRYQGHNRNPWNEFECGSNYARSMASFAAIPVLSGFTFDALSAHMGFAPKHYENGTFRSVWSNGAAWGQVEVSERQTLVSVVGGTLMLREFDNNGQVITATELASAGMGTLKNGMLTLQSGEALKL